MSRCGPCKSIAPKFVSLSTKYPSAVFLKVDVDECQVGGACWFSCYLFVCFVDPQALFNGSLRDLEWLLKIIHFGKILFKSQILCL